MMRETPDNAYDLAIVDPPYGINVGDNKSGMGRRKGDAKATYKMGDWDSAPPPDEYFAELLHRTDAAELSMLARVGQTLLE